MKKKFYLTTAIPYVNSPPHIGFAFEIVIADAIARYKRLIGNEVFFLTGTDENSLKNVQAAQKEGISPKELVKKNAQKFYQLKETLNLSFNDFIRTTEKRHFLGAQKLWRLCQKDIYKKKYRGLYCLGCEQFYKKEELKNGLCPEHKIKPEIVEEENYFFRLSKYQKRIKEIIEKEKVKIFPETRKKEVLSFIEKGLEDICVSRESKRAKGWGVPVPGDKSQIIWVWMDALSNYLNGVGFSQNEKIFKKWWPANLHVIGKGILRFHAIYWIGILLSSKLPLPKEILVHGYVTVKGEKMSKSLGNVIEPEVLVKKYGTDAVRYYLLRESSPFEDLDFTFEKFEKRYTFDLAFGLGNLIARIFGLAKKLGFKKEKKKIENQILKKKIKESWQKYHSFFKEYKLNQVLISVWDLISFCDFLIQKEKPWEKKKNAQVLISDLFLTEREIAKMIYPFLPQTSEKILAQIKTKKGEILFPKIQ